MNNASSFVKSKPSCILHFFITKSRFYEHVFIKQFFNNIKNINLAVVHTFSVLVNESNYEENREELYTELVLGRHLASNERKSTLVFIVTLRNTWQ